LIGSVAGDQPTAERAHAAFGELLQEEARRGARKQQRDRRTRSRSS
jgi:hypothetical protein